MIRLQIGINYFRGIVMKKLFVIIGIISIALYCMEPPVPEIPEIKVYQTIPLRKLALKATSKLPADKIIAQLETLPTDLYFPLAFYIFIDPAIRFINKKKIIIAMVNILNKKKVPDSRITLLKNLLDKNIFFLVKKGAFLRGIDSLVQKSLRGKGAKNLLHLAIEKQDFPLIKFLLEEGANANSSIHNLSHPKYLPIALAIKTQNIPIISLIAKHMSKLDAVFLSDISFHPVILAARTGNQNIVNVLLQNGFELNKIYQIGQANQTILDTINQDISHWKKNKTALQKAKVLLTKMGAKTVAELSEKK